MLTITGPEKLDVEFHLQVRGNPVQNNTQVDNSGKTTYFSFFYMICLESVEVMYVYPNEP